MSEGTTLEKQVPNGEGAEIGLIFLAREAAARLGGSEVSWEMSGDQLIRAAKSQRVRQNPELDCQKWVRLPLLAPCSQVLTLPSSLTHGRVQPHPSPCF